MEVGASASHFLSCKNPEGALGTGSMAASGHDKIGAMQATSTTGELNTTLPREAIKPMANKRIIARINALLHQEKVNSISISGTPTHTKANNSLGKVTIGWPPGAAALTVTKLWPGLPPPPRCYSTALLEIHFLSGGQCPLFDGTAAAQGVYFTQNESSSIPLYVRPHLPWRAPFRCLTITSFRTITLCCSHHP